jgi:hypothetical protein
MQEKETVVCPLFIKRCREVRGWISPAAATFSLFIAVKEELSGETRRRSWRRKRAKKKRRRRWMMMMLLMIFHKGKKERTQVVPSHTSQEEEEEQQHPKSLDSSKSGI